MMETGRIKTAIAFLKDGKSFNVGDLKLGMSDKNEMYIVGFSQRLTLENLTKQEALSELNEIKNHFNQMVKLSNELKIFIQDKRLEFILSFNYGMGALGICSEKDGEVHWEIDLN